MADTDSLDSIASSSSIAQPSYTYAVNYGGNGQLNGYCDQTEAVKQAIYKIINTERYRYIIYSWNYGIELEDLYGQPIPYIYAEAQRRIIEALLQDDRIEKVYDFTWSHNGPDVITHFSVDTIYVTTIRDLEKELKGIV